MLSEINTWMPLSCAALLGRGARAPETDPDEPLHHVHVRQHHLHLPHHDGLHDGLETHTGAHVHVSQYVTGTSTVVSRYSHMTPPKHHLVIPSVLSL